jgi:hypothetical protein
MKDKGPVSSAMTPTFRGAQTQRRPRVTPRVVIIPLVANSAIFGNPGFATLAGDGFTLMREAFESLGSDLAATPFDLIMVSVKGPTAAVHRAGSAAPSNARFAYVDDVCGIPPATQVLIVSPVLRTVTRGLLTEAPTLHRVERQHLRVVVQHSVDE